MIKKTNQGFTLAELILAAAILAFALSGLLLLFSNCILLNEANRHLTLATSHGQYLLEGIKHLAFADIPTQISAGDWNWNSTDLINVGLTPLDNESIATGVSGTNPLDLAVTVNWNDRGQRARSIVLETLITNY